MYDSRTDKGRYSTHGHCKCDWCYPEMLPGRRRRETRAWQADAQEALTGVSIVSRPGIRRQKSRKRQVEDDLTWAIRIMRQN